MNALIYQFEDEGCGIASLRSLMVLLSKRGRYRFASLTGHPPYSLKELSIGANKYGFRLNFYEGYHGEFGYPSRKKGPFLALLGPRGKGHLVVVKKIKEREVIYLDPDKGKVKEKKSLFMSKWSGIYGYMEKKDESLPKAPTKPKTISFLVPLTITMLLVLGEASVFAGFYLLGGMESFPSIILLFLIFALLELIRHLLALLLMKRFDKRYLLDSFDPSPERMRKNYESYCLYKKAVYAELPQAVGSLYASLSFSLLLAFNNPYCLIAVLALSLFIVLFETSYSSSFARKKEHLASLERELGERGNRESKQKALKSLSLEASDYGNRMLLGRVVYVFLVFALAFIPFLGTSGFSLNYYLFHLFSLLGIGEGVRLFASFLASLSQKERLEGYFIEYFLEKKD